MKAPRKRSHGNLPLTLLASAALLGVLACDSPSTEPAAASATAEEESAPALDGFCQTICERTSRCGVELAKREASKLDGELIAELERALDEETKRCVSECGKSPVDEAEKFQMERAQICLGKTDCDELSRCMAAL